MQIIEHQYLHYKNLLTFETESDCSAIPDFIRGIAESLTVLDLKQCGNIIFTIKPSKIQFLIPVDNIFESGKHYSYKREFKIVNAVRTRHYGTGQEISKSIILLKKYITEHSMNAVTPPYIVANGKLNDVYDVFIGVNENIL